MKTMKVPFQAKLGLYAFLLMLVFQSCSKDDMIEPSLASELAKASENLDQNISEFKGTLPAACKEVCLVAGQHNYVGTVSTTMLEGDLLVTYQVTAPGVYLKEVHLETFLSLESIDVKGKESILNNGNPAPGKFDYQKAFAEGSQVTTFTVQIPKENIEELNASCFQIATHAALTNGETAWGGLCDRDGDAASLAPAKQFPGNNWAVFFEFCKEDCGNTVDFTYAWEDIRYNNNDADYNDVVIQADVIRTSSQMNLEFSLKARGAGYDHNFSFKIPKAGIVNILGVDSEDISSDANFYYIRVFESTKTLTANNRNTEVNGKCFNTVTKSVTLQTNASFVYNAEKPYEPFITVFTSGSIADVSRPVYDLYVWEISARDTWKGAANKVYPNGIVIPSDWKWPLERTNITKVYPNFKSITDGFNYDWAAVLGDASLTYDAAADACE